MMRYSLILSAAVIFVLGFAACKKSDKADHSRTVANISGTYNLTGLTANLGSINFNLYDTLPACQQDNLVILNTDGSAQFVDGGVTCTPPVDSSSVWHLSANGDSLYLGENSGLIKTFDGKNLVVTTDHFDGFSGDITISLTKH